MTKDVYIRHYYSEFLTLLVVDLKICVLLTFHVFSCLLLGRRDITSMTYLNVIGRSHEIPLVVRVYVS